MWTPFSNWSPRAPGQALIGRGFGRLAWWAASQVTASYWLDTGRPVPKHQAVEVAVALFWSGLSGGTSARCGSTRVMSRCTKARQHRLAARRGSRRGGARPRMNGWEQVPGGRIQSMVSRGHSRCRERGPVAVLRSIHERRGTPRPGFCCSAPLSRCGVECRD